MTIDSISKITSIILCNYPIYMNQLDDLQSNWNIVENIVNSIMTVDVYKECISISPIMDLFLPWNTKWTSQDDLDSFVSINYESLLEKFKIYLKTLFAKTNKVLIKVTQNYPESIRLKLFNIFTEEVSNKLLKANDINDLMSIINKQFDPLYLMITSARANIWKDEKYEIPGTTFNYQQWNVEIATIILMNSMFSYYGSYKENGGKCFGIKFKETPIFDLWDRKTFKESSTNGITFTISKESGTMTFKNSVNEITKYNNPTLLISELLLNNQNPFDVDYQTMPSITCDLYTMKDILSYVEDYRKQSNRSWMTFGDVLIGFDESDTYTNQTFKRSIYNNIMQKVCNWTLFIPLNTFFDCSNINKVHDDYGITIKPSDLAKYNEIESVSKQLDVGVLSDSMKEIYNRATESKRLGNVLKINTMSMSNPPTEEEITRYNEIKKLL